MHTAAHVCCTTTRDKVLIGIAVRTPAWQYNGHLGWTCRVSEGQGALPPVADQYVSVSD